MWPYSFAFLSDSGARAGRLEDEELVLSKYVEPFLKDSPLYTDNTADGIALLWAPRPFDL